MPSGGDKGVINPQKKKKIEKLGHPYLYGNPPPKKIKGLDILAQFRQRIEPITYQAKIDTILVNHY